jgi:hypothetical protein
LQRHSTGLCGRLRGRRFRLAVTLFRARRLTLMRLALTVLVSGFPFPSTYGLVIAQ